MPDHPPMPGRLTIHLDAIAENWRRLRAMGDAECGAVVKADAYGLGMAQVAPALAAAGCRSFFVAFLDEGLALRAILGQGPRIFVLCADRRDDTALYAAHGLVPVISSDEHFEGWSASGRLEGLPFLVQADTGMHRLGVGPEQALDLLQQPSCLGLMSHLACADEPQHDLNARQLACFKGIVARAPRLPRRPVLSLANSCGIALGAEWQFTLTRPGIALYGGNPTPGRANPMRPAVTLEAPILQLLEVKTGDTVGYGATFTARRPSRIAILPLGYADGVLRQLSGKGEAVVAGRRVPYAGRVSMDMLALDVTDVPPDRLAGDAMAQIIGPDRTVDEVAAAAGTISYELLTRLGPRLARTWLGGDSP
jgi:alanine racemase